VTGVPPPGTVAAVRDERTLSTQPKQNGDEIGVTPLHTSSSRDIACVLQVQKGGPLCGGN
jgi:hypothetical protein